MTTRDANKYAMITRATIDFNKFLRLLKGKIIISKIKPKIANINLTTNFTA